MSRDHEVVPPHLEAAVLGAFLVVGFGIGWNPPDQLLAFGSDYGLTLSGFAASDPFSLDGIWEEG